MRQVDDYDLELFAINTGDFYRAHRSMAETNADLVVWIRHVQGPVLRRYCSEIEPVFAGAATVAFVARRLMRYYEQHIKELP